MSILKISALAVPAVVALLIASGRAVAQPGSDEDVETVWAVDLIRTLPGGQEEYLNNIEANWAQARDLALAQGVIVSYLALAAEPDSIRGWDVLLMTEYTDSLAWAQREEIFAAIFDSPEYERVEMKRPNSELREFVSGSVTMRGVAPDE